VAHHPSVGTLLCSRYAACLIDLETYVITKYLKPQVVHRPPRDVDIDDVVHTSFHLGEVDMGTRHLKVPEPTNSEIWKKMVAETTSLSQVFGYMRLLEESVKWDRSASNARCKVCRRGTSSDALLLCDKCDDGYHMQCLNPSISEVPDGDWFCPKCDPDSFAPPKSRKKKRKKEEEEGSADESGELQAESAPVAKKKRKKAAAAEEEEGSDASDDRQVETQNPKKSRKSGGSLGAAARPPKRPSAVSARKAAKQALASDDDEDFEDDADKPTSRPSSRRSARASTDGVSPSDVGLDLAQEILDKLVVEETAKWFLEPVRKRDAPDYSELVKHAMDLGQLKVNLKRGDYPGVVEFVSDLTLVFDNAILYNGPKSEVTSDAIALRLLFEDTFSSRLANFTKQPARSKRKRST
jgi:hypothetical protein